ncbi:MAG TPA: YdeI/OmpD-associated family protein [Chloroflexota bacterium]|nr:YdeI/OmpD-associated family protein [Chloroflexota bacterium]
MKDGLPVVSFASKEAWEAWLAQEHERSAGVWLKLAKKSSGVSSVTYDEALDVALCYGWIDGQKGALDATHWVQRFTPRSGKGNWSKINTDKAERLIAEGRMKAAGLRQVDLAKADGRWEAAYSGQRSATVPEDLQQALEASPAAKALFEQLNSANRYAILYRVQNAKRPETRATRIQKFVGMLERGETLHPQMIVISLGRGGSGGLSLPRRE